MLKWISFLGCFLSFSLAQAQTFQVFKGDTINRRDKEGKKQGIWRKYYSNDTLCSESTFKFGRHTGEFKTWDKKGKLQSRLVYRGLTEVSNATLYYEDGIVKAKGKYVNQDKDSTWTYFDEKGKLQSTEYYLKGKKEGLWKVYYPNGKVAMETIYKLGVKNGPYREFFSDGTKKLLATNKNGEYDGMVIIMFPGEKVWMQGKYVNGVRDGKWIINKDNGTLEREEIYKMGVLMNPVPEKEERIDESTIQKGPDKQ